MASKSKKRRKVLGASCILAALIIAGSSFAWFTSKDEVTNRLTANADYGVSIVESFAPPENWLPGQEVNKDVYATNTGNISAFVEESVSGTMTVVKEVSVPSANFDTEKNNLNKLTAGERYVIEAGSYLALAPGGVTKGDKIVATTPNNADLDAYVSEADDFVPTAKGLYVFRRSIAVAEDKTETFEYQGYYYADGQFYKVKINTVTPDDKADIAGDGNKTDGQLSSATYTLSKDETTKVSPTSLEYDSGNHRLIATVAGTTAPTNLSTLAADYDKAVHEYERALAAQTAAVRDDNTASDTLKAAIAADNAAKADLASKQAAYDQEVANYNNISNQIGNATSGATQAKNSADTALANAKSTLYGTDDYTPTTQPYAVDGTYNQTQVTALNGGSYKDVLQAKLDKDAAPADRDGFTAELLAWGQDTTKGNKGWNDGTTYDQMVADMTYADFTQFKTDVAAGGGSDVHNRYAKEADYLAKLKKYNDDVADYNAKSAAATAATTTLTNLQTALANSATKLYGNPTGTGAPKTPTEATTYAATITTEAQYNAAVTGNMLDTGLFKDYMEAKGKAATAAAAKTVAETAAGSPGTSADLTAANAAVVAAKTALDNAKVAYDEAVSASASAGDIVIYINLKNDVTNATANNQWQILPSTVASNKAYFYYTGILGAGETSSQLIDSVKLADSVTQDMYKYFDFDLNVELKSAQVIYDDNGNVVATAVNGDNTVSPAIPGELDAKVTVADPDKEDTTILSWATT